MFPDIASLKTRHPSAADIPALVSFANICAQIDLGRGAVNSVEQLQAFWDSPDLHPERDILLVVDANDTIVASLTALITPPYNMVYQELNVHPVYRGQGLEEFLLERAETHAASTLELLDDDIPAAIIHGVPTGLTWLRHLLDAHGYTIGQEIVQLQRDISGGIDIPALPAGVVVQPYADDQAAAISTAMREINQDVGEGVLPSFEAILLQPNFDPSLVIAAWQGNAVAAVAILLPTTATTAQAMVVGVRRAWRGEGLGGQVLQIGLRVLKAMGITTVNATVTRPQHATYLERLGFTPIDTTVIYQKPLR